MFKIFGRGNPTPEQPPQAPSIPEAEGGLDRLKSAVSLTGRSLIGRIVSLGRADADRLSEENLDAIEEALIRADVGVDLAVDLTESIRKNPALHKPDALKQFLHDEFTRLLAMGPHANSIKIEAGTLTVILVVGVNGAGKTTLIGKMASRLGQAGKRVVIAAGDTFRAAAEEQIDIWAQRAGATLVRQDGADPAAVIHDALQQALSTEADILIIDTAGRLQNKFNLMEELKKIRRVLSSGVPPEANYEALLVVDATTGQNALRQAEVFQEAVDLTGVALTKLDGSSKGGIVFNIARQYHLPVKLVGVGEGIDDLRDFDTAAFIDALFETAHAYDFSARF